MEPFYPNTWALRQTFSDTDFRLYFKRRLGRTKKVVLEKRDARIEEFQHNYSLINFYIGIASQAYKFFKYFIFHVKYLYFIKKKQKLNYK